MAKGIRLPEGNIASFFGFITVYLFVIYSHSRASCQAGPSPSSLETGLIVLGTRWSVLHVIQIVILVQVIITWIADPTRITRRSLSTSDQHDVCTSAVTSKSYVKGVGGPDRHRGIKPALKLDATLLGTSTSCSIHAMSALEIVL